MSVTDQMKIENVIKSGLLAAAVVFSANALADTGFKVPLHYNVELVDGVDDPDNFSNWTKFITLTPGRHQIVLTFKDTFGSSDSEMIQSANPVVIDIPDLKPDQVMTFKFDNITTKDQARRYASQQKVELTDIDGNPLSGSEASYFVMTSETGFAMIRDYRQELMSLNRLYAPTYQAGGDRAIGMTDYGTPTIRAQSMMGGQSVPTNITMDAPQLGYDQESTMATSSKRGGQIKSAGSVSLNQLINLYEQADDKTKLQFVKYVMSN